MNKTKTFRTKLWLYFVLFAAIIFSLLWILQTVFLQTFYNNMLEKNTRSVAEKIARVSTDKNLEDSIDKFAYQNSLLVFITDSDGDVLYSSDSYKSFYRQSSGRSGKDGAQKKGDEPGRKSAVYRDLPDDYEEFAASLINSEDGKAEYVTDDKYVYGTLLKLSDGSDALLYVSVTLGAVGATAYIVRIQLLWVTLLSLVIAFIIAFCIAKRFSKPIDLLSSQARSLGGDKYENNFKKGFCRELDELNDSIDEAAEKLGKAKEYQKELLSNVSHDLRTPLTMIRGYAEMVRDVSWEDSEQRESDLGIIIRESDRLEALVNEILEYSGLQETGIKREFEAVDLGALAEDVAKRFESVFKATGGTVEYNIRQGCTVIGNEALLERAVYNLVDNAVKHSGDGKTVTVSVYEENGTVLSVSDSGDGIDENDLPHIWEKYYTSRQRGNKGVSGLGLAIVKQIAVIHNADCSVKSEKGKGAEFTLRFKKEK